MNLPSREQCFAYFKQYHTPQNIIKHSLAVNQVANYLAGELSKAGEQINLDLVDRASLLHDVIRVIDIKGDLFAFTEEQDKTDENIKAWLEQRKKYQGQHHANAIADLFKEQYPEMSEVIRTHRLSAVIKNQLTSWEKKIVYYADKRVNHDKKVDLKTRMNEGRKRWRVDPQNDHVDELLSKMQKLEQEIFSKINKQPEIINEL